MLLHVESEDEPLNTSTQEKEDDVLENRLAQALKKIEGNTLKSF